MNLFQFLHAALMLDAPCRWRNRMVIMIPQLYFGTAVLCQIQLCKDNYKRQTSIQLTEWFHWRHSRSAFSGCAFVLYCISCRKLMPSGCIRLHAGTSAAARGSCGRCRGTPECTWIRLPDRASAWWKPAGSWSR